MTYTPKPGEPESSAANPMKNGVLGMLLDKLGLRGLMHGLGGRKAVIGGGAIGAITFIAQSDMSDWPKAIACAAVAIITAATTISIAMEDKK